MLKEDSLKHLATLLPEKKPEPTVLVKTLERALCLSAEYGYKKNPETFDKFFNALFPNKEKEVGQIETIFNGTKDFLSDLLLTFGSGIFDIQEKIDKAGCECEKTVNISEDL